MNIRSLFSRRHREQELDAEIQAHLTMATRDRVARGEDPEAAELAARREFGNRALIQESTRGMWRWNSLETVWQDVRYGLRGMRRSPGFMAVAVVSLALGIGANTAIFSLINTIMLRMLPVENPGQLVELLFKAPRQDHFNAFSWQSYQYYREQNHVFAGLMASASESFAVEGEGLGPESVQGLYITPTYFPVLGVKPALGRLIGPEDGDVGSPANVVVLNWAYWKNRFNLDPAIIGRRIIVDRIPLTIIGVTPREFSGLEPWTRQDLWLPIAMESMIHHPSRTRTARYWLKLAARLKPGVSIGQARAEMKVLFQWTIEDELKTNDDLSVREWKIEVQPAGDGLSHLRDQYARPVLLLMAVVALLLLIACINVASLLLTRGAARQREMALRVSLGAGRIRLLCQVLTESLLLAALGGLLGIFFAYLGTGGLARIVASGRDRIELQARPDWVVLLFAAGVALLTGILFGLAPAWHAFRSVPASSLRQTGRADETKPWRLFGKCLVVTQVAFSVILLSVASLFVRHIVNLQYLDLGFHRDHVLLVSLDPASSGYDRERLSRAYHELLGRLEAIPGVRSATICGILPMAGAGAMRTATVEGYQAKPGERRFLSENWVAPQYFETLGIPLLRGRDFSFQDKGRARVAIVNQTLVRYFFGTSNPIGRHIEFDGDDRPFEIVGVVGNAKSADMREPSLRFVYFNMFQLGSVLSQFAIRTARDPGGIAAEVRRTVRESLKSVPVVRITTLDHQVDASIVPERLIAMLSGLFGALGALLAALGLYGLLAYAVARRINEIGIRMALGASRRDITRMVFGEALGMSCGGIVVGVVGAYWSKRLTASMITGLPIESAFPIAFGAIMMIALALLAASIPARRATRIEPMEALRHD